MHSAVQVYRPDWNSGFGAVPDHAAVTRRSLLEDCVERAVLLPAHFSVPHAFRVKERNGGYAVIDAL